MGRPEYVVGVNPAIYPPRNGLPARKTVKSPWHNFQSELFMRESHTNSTRTAFAASSTVYKIRYLLYISFRYSFSSTFEWKTGYRYGVFSKPLILVSRSLCSNRAALTLTCARNAMCSSSIAFASLLKVTWYVRSGIFVVVLFFSDVQYLL